MPWDRATPCRSWMLVSQAHLKGGRDRLGEAGPGAQGQFSAPPFLSRALMFTSSLAAWTHRLVSPHFSLFAQPALFGALSQRSLLPLTGPQAAFLPLIRWCFFICGSGTPLRAFSTLLLCLSSSQRLEGNDFFSHHWDAQSLTRSQTIAAAR